VSIFTWSVVADLMCFQLWTEQSSRDFIEESYPWFLSTYDSYRYPVQRVDTVRLFLLREYGGIYLDLDNVSFFYPPL
jgi:inositol phosphorylceramide mannosyltransferase catalytic subunit